MPHNAAGMQADAPEKGSRDIGGSFGDRSETCEA